MPEGRPEDYLLDENGRPVGLMADPAAEATGFDPGIGPYMDRPGMPRDADYKVNTPRGPLYNQGAADYTRDRAQHIRDWQASRNVSSAPAEDARLDKPASAAEPSGEVSNLDMARAVYNSLRERIAAEADNPRGMPRPPARMERGMEAAEAKAKVPLAQADAAAKGVEFEQLDALLKHREKLDKIGPDAYSDWVKTPGGHDFIESMLQHSAKQEFREREGYHMPDRPGYEEPKPQPSHWEKMYEQMRKGKEDSAAVDRILREAERSKMDPV